MGPCPLSEDSAARCVGSGLAKAPAHEGLTRDGGEGVYEAAVVEWEANVFGVEAADEG